MNTMQLTELILLRLYQLANEHNFGAMFFLAELAGEWGITDFERIRGVAEALSNRGLIRTLTAGRRIQACITTEGALFVEHGGETGIIREYQINPEKFVLKIDQSTNFYGAVTSSNVASHSPAAIQAVGQLSPEIDALLQQIRSTIQADPQLSETHRTEAWADVDLIRAELLRSEPRQAMLKAALGTLGDIASIASLAIQLGLMALGK